jgi:regulator of replication initiation timing
MAHSSASKKSNKDDSGSDSEEEVNNEPSFLIAENARLNDLLGNRDDVLRKTNKEKREYRSLLGEAKEKVVELESLLDDARAQIDSLKYAPVVTNEPECTDCSTFLGELTVLKEKYDSKVEELDALRVELDEMKSRSSLLGACTSYPVLHEKLDVSLVFARSLEAQLKAPIPTIFSTSEINVVKNMELAHYVDRLQDEIDELRKLMGWLSGHEPQLRIMIETYKRQDEEALGAKKVGEGSGESDIPEPPKTHHKNAFVPKPNHLRNRLDTTPAPPVFPPQTNNFQKPIKFKSVLGNEFFGKNGEKPSEEKLEPKENPKPKPKPKPFHCEHCGRDGHLVGFCFRRKHEERLARELSNKDRYRPSRGVPEPRLVPRGEGMVRIIYPRERRVFVPCREPPHKEGGRRVGFGCVEFARRSCSWPIQVWGE